MDLYAFENYKAAFRFRLKELQSLGRPLTLKKIADRVPMQYTYLSRVLNRSELHLTEEQAFTIARQLEFVSEEIDYLLLLRSYSSSEPTERKQYLLTKLERVRKKGMVRATSQDAPIGRLTQEMAYLFDPMCVLIYIALHIPEYRENPRLIGPKLGLSTTQLKDVLRKLDAMAFIAVKPDGLRIEKVNDAHLHYGTDHPLMRVHQQVMKTPLLNQLLRTPEDRKHCFQATFTMDQLGFEAVQKEFKTFVRKIEEIVRKSKSENVYQLGFDLLEWM